jgi:hypothetical protein
MATIERKARKEIFSLSAPTGFLRSREWEKVAAGRMRVVEEKQTFGVRCRNPI